MPHRRSENVARARGYVECHGEPSRIDQLARLLDHVETRTLRDVARWLRTLAKPGTQMADYYEEAARQLDEGYLPAPRSRAGKGPKVRAVEATNDPDRATE